MSDDKTKQCQSTEGGWLVIQTGLSLTRLTSPCYNNTTCMQVPRHSLSSYGRQTFSVAGQAAWNSLSDDLCDPTLSTDSFRRLLKTFVFSQY